MCFPGHSGVKNLPASARGEGDIGKIPWRRKWQPTPVFLLGKSHGQRSLVGFSPTGHRELNTAEGMSSYEKYTWGFVTHF